MPITEERFRDILSEELKHSENRIVLRLTTVGLDMENPIEQQADLRFLRNSRKVVRRSAFALITALITAGTAWVGGLFQMKG